MSARARPASLLPFELVDMNPQLRIHGRYSLDPSRRAGLPIVGVKLFKHKSGARRGESPRYDANWAPAERQDLEYLVHAANAYPKLVEILQVIAATPGLEERYAHMLRDVRALLGSLGEGS